MLMVWQRTPVFFLRHQKENGPHPKAAQQPTAAQCAVKRKNAGSHRTAPSQSSDSRVFGLAETSLEVPDALSSSFRWHFRTALIHRRGSDSEKRKKSIRQAPTNLPPHQTRGEVWFNCHPPARASSRSPILVGIYLEAPVLKQTCTHVQVCAQRLFFWTVHSPFSFRFAEKKMGGGLPRHHHGTIFRPIGTAPGGTPHGTAS